MSASDERASDEAFIANIKIQDAKINFKPGRHVDTFAFTLDSLKLLS